MITISQLNGNSLKRSLEVKRVCKAYHNKHKNLSGNFGFVVVVDNPQGLSEKVISRYRDTWFSLTGDYDSRGFVSSLRFGLYSDFCPEISSISEIDISGAIKLIKERIPVYLKERAKI